MKKVLELLINLLFLGTSVLGFVLPSSVYLSNEAWEGLYLTNIINAVVLTLYLALRVLRWNRDAMETLQRGLLLFVLYSCLPVFILISNPVTRIFSGLCFAGSLILFLLKSRENQASPSFGSLKKAWRIALSLLLILFGASFIGRGIIMLPQYKDGLASLTDMLVSVSDIIICAIWIPVAIGFLKKRPFGDANILAVYYQATLLFISLLAFLFLQPLVTGGRLDWESIVVIGVMGMLFFIPTLYLVQKKARPSEHQTPGCIALKVRGGHP